MRIRIDDIKENGLIRDFSVPVGEFSGLAEVDDAVAILRPLQIHLRAVRAGEMIEVEGRVQTLFRFACSRCLTDFETAVDLPFALTYARQIPEVHTEGEDEEIELDAESMGLIPFTGDEIDLHEGIQEQVVMNIPLQPLCDQACRGLCPQCGTDLNAGRCECGPAETEFRNRFAALKGFKVEKK